MMNKQCNIGPNFYTRVKVLSQHLYEGPQNMSLHIVNMKNDNSRTNDKERCELNYVDLGQVLTLW
jgi:hypothetical protein